MSEPIRIEIETTDCGRRYSAYVPGDAAPLVSGSRDPEHDACRVLVRRGYDGPVRFCRRGVPQMLFKSARVAAGKYIEESATRGPKLARWKPHPMLAAKGAIPVRT